MNKKEEKTIALILEAFERLLETKTYSEKHRFPINFLFAFQKER